MIERDSGIVPSGASVASRVKIGSRNRQATFGQVQPRYLFEASIANSACLRSPTSPAEVVKGLLHKRHELVNHDLCIGLKTTGQARWGRGQSGEVVQRPMHK